MSLHDRVLTWAILAVAGLLFLNVLLWLANRILSFAGY